MRVGVRKEKDEDHKNICRLPYRYNSYLMLLSLHLSALEDVIKIAASIPFVLLSLWLRN